MEPRMIYKKAAVSSSASYSKIAKTFKPTSFQTKLITSEVTRSQSPKTKANIAIRPKYLNPQHFGFNAPLTFVIMRRVEEYCDMIQ
jgi:hypothetical protein